MEGIPSFAELFPDTRGATATKNKPNELGQDEFMTLMVAQLENQDPTKPMDNFQFLGQIAQFGTVSGIQELQEGLSSLSSALLSNQTLQAADLVGRDVITGSNIGTLQQEGELGAEIQLPQPVGNVMLYVQDMSGRLVAAQPLGAAPAGSFKINWDGTDGNGDRVPPGQYRLSAEAIAGGQNQAVSVYAHQRVDSVSLNPNGAGLQLNLASGNQIDMSEIKSIF